MSRIAIRLPTDIAHSIRYKRYVNITPIELSIYRRMRKKHRVFFIFTKV
jgi:hypothetical protein